MILASITGFELALLIQTGIVFILVCVAKITWPSPWTYVMGIVGTIYALQAFGYFMEVWMRATGNI